MVRVRRTTVIDAPVDAVWRILRDFNGHDRWHPIVERSALEDGRRTDQVGAVRNFTITSGERVREVLLSLSDRERRLRYAIVDSGLPLENYVAELFLKPVTDGGGTFWSWSSRFRTPPGDEAALAELVGKEVYEAGFDGVRSALGLPSAAGTPGAAGAAVAHGPRTSMLASDTTPARTPAGSRPARSDHRIGGARPAGAIEGEAMTIARHGGPEVFACAPSSAPPPGPGEVRVRHTAIGVNYIDVYCRTGYFDLVPPGGRRASRRREPSSTSAPGSGISRPASASPMPVRPPARTSRCGRWTRPSSSPSPPGSTTRRRRRCS